MQLHRTPSRLFSYLTTERLLLGTVLSSSLVLLIEFVLATHNGRGAKRRQARASKARHHDEVARLGHIATRGLGRRGRGSRRGGRGDVLVVTLLSIGIGLSRACIGRSIGIAISPGLGSLARSVLIRRRAGVDTGRQ